MVVIIKAHNHLYHLNPGQVHCSNTYVGAELHVELEDDCILQQGGVDAPPCDGARIHCVMEE